MLDSEMISRRSLLAHVSIASGASLAQPRPSEDIYLVQGVTLFAIGLLDILKSEDSGNGRVRVTVALTADIRDLRKRLPTSVGSIAAVQKTALVLTELKLQMRPLYWLQQRVQEILWISSVSAASTNRQSVFA